MIRFLWALVLLVVSVTPVAGQTLSAAAFLSSAKDDLRVRNHRELLDYLASAARDTPYIDRIELRTETDNFDILRQRYALRVYPRGWGETSSARNVHYARSIAKRYEQRRLLIDALAERYELLLEYVEVKQLIALYQSLLATIGDGIAVLRRLTGVVQSRIDLNPLLTAEDRYVDLQLDLVRLEDRMTSVSHKVLALAKGAKQIGFSADQLKDVQSIAAVARELAKSKATPNNVDLETRRAEVGLAQARYRLEVARQHDYLSYLALEYDTQFRDSSQRAFSLNLGIKLPFIRRDSDDIDRRKTAHLSEKLRYAQAVYRARERQRSVLSSLERLVRQHDILIRRKTTGDAKTSFERYRKMEGIDPLALLRLKQSIIEGDIRVVRLERSIRTRFVQLLVLLGRLDGPPLTNQLSRAGERLFGG
ncbi:MAG: hypothetical protein H6707_00300 [Deltaproteobacteria bacterium]|nr:hypothetical protein [Deltaproteobacteria bacterium]